jgi:hypothetical protein
MPCVCCSRLQYSTQGFHPEKWQDLTTTLDGPEVKIFQEACKKNKVGAAQKSRLHCSCVVSKLPQVYEHLMLSQRHC